MYVATRSAVGSRAGPPHTFARPETHGSSIARYREDAAGVFDRFHGIERRLDGRLDASRIGRAPEFLDRTGFERRLNLPPPQFFERARAAERVVQYWARRLPKRASAYVVRRT